MEPQLYITRLARGSISFLFFNFINIFTRIPCAEFVENRRYRRYRRRCLKTIEDENNARVRSTGRIIAINVCAPA